jgi:hypothetical protein
MAEVAATESVTAQIMTTLGAGSGLNITKLAEDLTSVERAPKQAKIEAAVTATEAKISAYGLISYQVSLLQTAFEALNDADELSTNSASSSDTAVSFSAVDGTAEAGSHNIEVTQLALEQRVKSAEYSSTSSSLNSGSSFDLAAPPAVLLLLQPIPLLGSSVRLTMPIWALLRLLLTPVLPVLTTALCSVELRAVRALLVFPRLLIWDSMR